MNQNPNPPAEDAAVTEPTEPVEPTAEPAAEPATPKKSRKKKDEATALTAEIDRLKAENDDLTDQYKRMLAEYQNYKRRTEQEKEQLGRFTTASVLQKLLPSLDNLERAAAAPDGEGYRAGVDMTLRQFAETLAALGLQEIEALGQPFDPEVHNAVSREDADGVESETVTEVFQKGYRLGERVLRPAMVKVAN